jgi:hypothetical protein
MELNAIANSARSAVVVPLTPPAETMPGAVLTGVPDAFCGQPGTAGAGGGGGGGGGGGTAPDFTVGGSAIATCASCSASRALGVGEVCGGGTLPAAVISTAVGTCTGAAVPGVAAARIPPKGRASASDVAAAIPQTDVRLMAT